MTTTKPPAYYEFHKRATKLAPDASVDAAAIVYALLALTEQVQGLRNDLGESLVIENADLEADQPL